ncbi:MAG: SDR family oxidoreductase [Anaerolineales bacterium]|nr:SDR family oxidoreductase [Anaerolineales bacterium]MCS7248446.1 SDR family oxidoreductase [Anaerolineales bacterium]MDW8162259.1 SDR family oxidoreductase [Anaerolineales bacterium]MDW8447806.1 SDR family oxidoreductase [Anaerolineales bacterium]
MSRSSVLESFKITDRVAIVTGGAGLLGREFCRTLAEAGAKVVVADLNEEAAAATAESLSRQGQQALPLQVDVTSPISVRQMIAQTLEAFGAVDILVNSAALDPKFDPQHSAHSTDFEDYPLELWNRALAVNLTGVFLCCQAAIPPMLRQGKGVIINIASIYGLNAPDQRIYQRPGHPPQYKPAYYTVTKAGVLGLTAYLAAYYGARNIRVNALTPGGVYNQHDEEFVRAYSARTMLGRMANLDELNGALLFLASDASAYVTGANLIVDGGWTAW